MVQEMFREKGNDGDGGAPLPSARRVLRSELGGVMITTIPQQRSVPVSISDDVPDDRLFLSSTCALRCFPGCVRVRPFCFEYFLMCRTVPSQYTKLIPRFAGPHCTRQVPNGSTTPLFISDPVIIIV